MLESLRPAVCVINYNGQAHLCRCLESIRERRSRFTEMLIVDSASTDRSTALITRFPEFRLLRLDRNGGPSLARNRGFEALSRSDAILFVDSDVVLGSGCPERLVEELEGCTDAVLAMPRILSLQPPHDLHYDGAGAHYLGLMAVEQGTATTGSAGVRTIGSIITACFLLHRRRWGVEPPFDEAFFSQYEDHDLGVRARLRGYSILSVEDASCRHGTGTPGLSVRGDAESSPDRVYLLLRNRWQIIIKTYRLRTILLVSPMLALFELMQIAWAMRHRRGREWLRAAGWIGRHLRPLLTKRRAIQRARVRSDRELLCGGTLPVRAASAPTPLQRSALDLLSRTADGYWRAIRGLV